jgi:hypothetical protein
MREEFELKPKPHSSQARYSPDYVRIFVIATVRVAPSTIHHASIHICGTERVGFIEQRDHGQQDRSDVLRWVPSFARQLAALWIVDWRVEDRDAQVAVLIHIRMPDFCDEANGWRRVRIVVWELHERLQNEGEIGS